jgi:hypothetical protein
MKIFFTAIAFLLVFPTTAQNKYEQGMQRAFQLWEDGQPWEAANLFERISQVEKDKWVAPFYVAQINVLQSFNEKDETRLVAQLAKAKSYLEIAEERSPANAELLVLEAQRLTAWVVFDGEKYGMTYSGRIASLYNEAAELAPSNPRVVLGKAQWDMGTARFFGQPVDKYCEDIKKAIALFEKEPPSTNFEPRGSVAYARKALEQNCGKQ